MPAVRISMRKIKEILRLRFESGLSYERIALACSVSKGVVTKYVNAFQSTDLIWPLPESLDDTQLEQQLLGRPKTQRRRDEYEPPQCEAIHQALKHKGVTLQLLWEEYQQSATGRCYSYVSAQGTTFFTSEITFIHCRLLQKPRSRDGSNTATHRKTTLLA
jgi:transposase-like protein